jgi:mono/diheme cytochrome c family protein
MKIQTITFGSLFVAAALAGCSGGGSSGGGGGGTAPPVSGPGVVTSALPVLDRDAVGYTFTTESLNSVVGAGRVDALGIAPNATDSLAVSSPLNEITRIDAAGTTAEDSFFAPASSLANVGTFVFAGTRDRTTSGNGDVFARTELAPGSYNWTTAINSSRSEAYVVSTGGQLYALLGGADQAGEIWSLNQADGTFSQTAAIGSWIPTSATARGSDVYVGATRNGLGGGEAQLIRMRLGVTEEIAIPGAGAGGNTRQEITGMATIANVGSGAGSETIVMTVGTFDLASNTPLGGFVVATNGTDFEVMNSYAQDAPTCLAFIDSTIYVGLANGGLEYRQADGSWTQESLPANNGVFSLLARDDATLLIGCRGQNGALLVVRTADSKVSTTPTPTDVYYSPEVANYLTNACASCHTNTGIVGTAMLLAAPLADQANHTIVAALTNSVDPAASTLITKATGQVVHTGGALLQVGSADHTMLVNWVTQGARFEATVTPPPPPPPVLSNFTADVKPILDGMGNACASCHTGRTAPNQFTYTGVNVNQDWQETMQFTNAGIPAQSELFQRGGVGGNQGHPVRTLTAAQQATITTWINDGRPLN